MNDDDCKSALFKEEELVAVKHDPDDPHECWCGTLCQADEHGNAYCPKCRERGEPTVH